MADCFMSIPRRRWALVLVGITISIASSAASAKPSRMPQPQRKVQHEQDPGVDTGLVKAATALFTEPSASSTRISALRKGDLTVLVSRVPSSGWLKVVQFTTGRQGWVKADRLIVRYTKRRAPGLDFRRELLGTTELPSVQISNASHKVLFVHIGSLPEIQIQPYTSKSLTIDSGAYSYNAASPGVIPAFGSMAFVTGGKYTWTFTIGKTGTGTRRKADPALIAEMNKLQAEVDAAAAEVRFQKQQIDADQAALTQKREAARRRSEEIEAQREKLDRSDGAAVDAFNKSVDAVNAELGSIREAEERLDALIELYNTKVEALNASEQRLDALADKINGTR